MILLRLTPSTVLSHPLIVIKYIIIFRPQDRNSKRNFGGISIMVKKCISNGITVLPFTYPNFSWIKLHSQYFNMSKDLYICFLYIHPENSTYSKKHGDQFENLTELIIS